MSDEQRTAPNGALIPDNFSSSFSRDLGPNREALLREAMNDPDFGGRIAALENKLQTLLEVLVMTGGISINDARKIMGF